MKRIKVRPRNVNIEARSFLVWGKDGKQHTKIIHPGDSLYTVPCPNCISKGMRQNLRRAARGSLVVDRKRRTDAWGVMADCRVANRRMKKDKRQRRKAS